VSASIFISLLNTTVKGIGMGRRRVDVENVREVVKKPASRTVEDIVDMMLSRIRFVEWQDSEMHSVFGLQNWPAASGLDGPLSEFRKVRAGTRCLSRMPLGIGGTIMGDCARSRASKSLGRCRQSINDWG